MDYREKKYLERVGQAVDDYIYEYLILPDETRIYVNPAAFEAYLKTIQPQLWAPEFRNAYDTIRAYKSLYNDEETEKSLSSAIDCLRSLAATYCPEIAQELGELHTSAAQPTAQEPQSETEKRTVNETTKSVSRPALPAGIKDTPGARAAFDSLVDAGYLDSEYKPTASAAKNVICAYMAATLSQLLGVDHWAKVFADFWNVKPILSQSYNQLNPGKQFITDIDKALAAAARNCEQLAQTKRGKELLRKK
ncbi:MAG: hypothetical protein J6J71_02710 [Prevotella sp.]|nr:hypothetical protein [Paludibacteraceae bacterium]MBP3573500.1 hypothetical protein [Prevotella sp.]